MTQLKDLSGRRFGNLVVLELSRIDERRHAWWRCQCDCGNEKEVSSNHLTRKIYSVKSCGCKMNSKKFQGDIRAFKSLYSQYRYNASARGHVFELSPEEFRHITSSDCHYCNEPPSMLSKAKGCDVAYVYNGIDRMNNDDGYTMYNSLPCCKRCNRAKNEMSYEEFLEWIEEIYNKFCIPKTSI